MTTAGLDKKVGPEPAAAARSGWQFVTLAMASKYPANQCSRPVIYVPYLPGLWLLFPIVRTSCMNFI